MKYCRRPGLTRRTRAGFTLLETTIAVSLLASVLGSVLFMLDSSSRAFRTGSVLARMDADADMALQAAARALRTSRADWLVPPLPAGSEEQLDFQRTVGVEDDGSATPGMLERLVFEYDELEADDGVDNDGDGLVDEGQLLLIRDVGGAEIERVLLRGVAEAAPGETLGNGLDDEGNGIVDDRGFSIRQVDQLLELRFTLQRMDSASAQLITQTYTRTIALRN